MALIKKQLTASFTDDVGNAVAEAIVTARLTRPDQDNGEHISPTTQTWRADANGDVTLELWPNTRGEADSAYHIRARDPETGRYVYDQVVVMPDSDSTLDAITDLKHDVKTPTEAWQAVETAQDARDTADNHATTAQRYASEDEDKSVVDAESGTDTGTFSSKHHRNHSEQAQAASESARDASQSARNASQSARDTALAHRDDANEHATTSKRWATETGITVVDADSGVDSGEYGAKEYAQGDLEGHGGSSKAWATDSQSPDGSGEKSAKTRAGEASSSASAAQTAQSASESARDASQSARDESQSARDTAQTYRDGAQSARDKAQDWAEGTEPGGSGTKSAKGWSEEAEGIVEGAIQQDGSVSMEADLDFGGNKAANLADGTASDDGVTKGQLDAVAQGRSYKNPVRVATAGANVDLTSATDPNPIDGVTLADGDRVLLKDQTDGTENGIYDAVTATDPTTWVRSDDADEDSEVVSGMAVISTEGDNGAEIMWLLTTDEPTLGTDALSFTGFNLAALVAGTGLNKTNNTVSVDGTVLRDSDRSSQGGNLVENDRDLDLDGDLILGDTKQVRFLDSNYHIRRDASNRIIVRANGIDRLFIHPDGSVRVGGSVTVQGADTLNAKELYQDDERVGPIESGTWTPVLEGSTTVGNNSYDMQQGSYVRRGRLVTIACRVRLDGSSGALDSAGSLQITGLPYPNNGTSLALAIELSAGGQMPSGNIIAADWGGGTNIRLRRHDNANGTNLQDEDATDDLFLWLSATYEN